MKIFPIGTSRLHEPLSLIKEKVNFPGVGYFHSTSQILHWLEVLSGKRSISIEESSFFFRKDQTPDNPFNLGVWQADYEVHFSVIDKESVIFCGVPSEYLDFIGQE